MDLKLLVERGEFGLAMTRIAVPVTTTPMRVRGRAGDGLYWALRTAGASTAVATSYLKALAQEIDVGEIGPDASFDLVIASRRSADGQVAEGDLLYAGLDRMIDRDLQLVRWTAGGKPVWVDAITIGQAPRQTDGMIWPVSARITSGFGLRIHPILRFARMHRGNRFRRPLGHPDPRRRRRPGDACRLGRWLRPAGADRPRRRPRHKLQPHELAGRRAGDVGAAGPVDRLCRLVAACRPAPHLHYEVYRGGVAVNPMGVKFTVAQRGADPGAVAAVRARLKELLGVGVKAGG